MVPHAIMATLTGFRSVNSTLAQRVWILLWLVSGQVLLLGVGVVDLTVFKFGMEKSPTVMRCEKWGYPIAMLVAMTFAIGGFVVVVQMISHDQICIRI